MVVSGPPVASCVKLQVPGDHDPPRYHSIDLLQYVAMKDDEDSCDHVFLLKNLKQVVCDRLSLSAVPDSELFYIDDEGDFICLRDDATFRHALEQFPGGALKIVLNPSTTFASTSGSLPGTTASSWEPVKAISAPPVTPSSNAAYANASVPVVPDADGLGEASEPPPPADQVIVDTEESSLVSTATFNSIPWRIRMIKLCWQTRDGVECRRVSIARILEGHEAIPSVQQLLALGRELAGRENVALFVKADDNETSAKRLATDADLARTLEESGTGDIKIWVQRHVAQNVRLLFGDRRSSLFSGGELLDDEGHASYFKLVERARSLVELGEAAIHFSHNNQVLETLVDLERVLAAENDGADGETVICCTTADQEEQTKRRRNSWMVVVALAIVICAGPLLASPWLRRSLGSPIESNAPVDKIVLSPLDAAIRGRHSQVRSHPTPRLLFYHKTNRATWQLPNNLIAGQYRAKGRVARLGPFPTFLYMGIAGKGDDDSTRTAQDYRDMPQSQLVHVTSTGGWDRFREETLGEFKVSEYDKEKVFFVAANDDKPVGVDMQEIWLELVRDA